MIRLRQMVRIGPSPNEIRGLSAAKEVTFAPMDALADGLGGLDISLKKTLGEVIGGSYNYFAEGDVLLAKVTPCFENGKKAIARGLSHGIGFATSEVHVIRPDCTKIDTRFLRYLLCSEDFRAEGMKSMTGAGGLRRVSENSILDYRPKVTDLETQKAIANFLDRETARIDQLIEKKQLLADLTECEFGNRIALAVTVGLDSRAPMRPSGYTWHPWIPEGWLVTRLKFLCAKIVDCLHETPGHDEDGEYPSIY